MSAYDIRIVQTDKHPGYIGLGITGNLHSTGLVHWYSGIPPIPSFDYMFMTPGAQEARDAQNRRILKLAQRLTNKGHDAANAAR